jgi:hypothetical protein
MCDQCQALRINGVLCHETGCPVAWKGHAVDCFVCGCEFVPEEKYDRTCPDCRADLDAQADEREEAQRENGEWLDDDDR